MRYSQSDKMEVIRIVEASDHEVLDNVTPADVYHSRAEETRASRERIKRDTMRLRRNFYAAAVAAGV